MTTHQKSDCQSMHIYFKNNPAKFCPNPIKLFKVLHQQEQQWEEEQDE